MSHKDSLCSTESVPHAKPDLKGEGRPWKNREDMRFSLPAGADTDDLGEETHNLQTVDTRTSGRIGGKWKEEAPSICLVIYTWHMMSHCPSL